MDDVVPHSQDEDSSAYHAQRDRLERNEFFKECLAPLRLVLKVLKVGMSSCPCSQRAPGTAPAVAPALPQPAMQAQEALGALSSRCDAPLSSCSV